LPAFAQSRWGASNVFKPHNSLTVLGGIREERKGIRKGMKGTKEEMTGSQEMGERERKWTDEAHPHDEIM